MRYFLKTETAAEMEASLLAAGIVRQQLALVNSGGAVVYPAAVFVNDGYTLDVVGVIRRPTGVMVLADDMPTPETAELPGYHANLIADLTPEQLGILPIIPEPKTPSRRFA